MMSRGLVVAAVLAGGLLWMTPGHASRPYQVLQLELDRAGVAPEKLASVVDAEPLLARLWFYAHVFDLAVPGLADAERIRIRTRAAALADQFAVRGTRVPRVVLDGESDGRLAVLAAEVREGIDAASRPRSTGDGRALPLTATSSATVRGVFYGLLHRAYISRNAMGGRARVGDLLDAARTLAGAWLHLTADDTLWRALAAYHGGTVPVDDLAVIAQGEVQGIGSLLIGDAPSARQALSNALTVERGRNGATPRSTFLRGGLAEAMLAAGDRPGALRERQSMIREFAAVESAWLPARARARIVELLVAGNDPTGLLAELETLRAAGPVATGDPDTAPIMLRAAAALRRAGEAVVGTDVARAESLFAGASATYTALRSPDVVAMAVPTAQREDEARARAAAAAAVDIARARLAEQRGLLDEAWQAATAARPDLSGADGPAADALLGRLALALGRLDDALSRTAAADAGLTDARLRVTNRAVRARVRLARGELPPAFAWANAALYDLRIAGLADDALDLRVELHRTAAAVLFAAGYDDAARARLVFALGLAAAPEAALDLSGARLDASDRPGALAATVTAASPELRVAAGCIQTLDDARAALDALDGVRAVDPVVALRRDVCRAIAQVRTGRASAARSMVPALLEAAGPHADPATTAGLQAVISVVGADAPTREQARRATLADRRRALGTGRPALKAVRPAPPVGIGSVTAGLAVDDATSLRHALGGADLLGRRWRPPPSGAATDEVRRAAAEVDGREAAFRRASKADRPQTRQALAAARQRLDAATAAQDTAHPRWSALVRPGTPDATSLLEPDAHQLVYRVGGNESRLWFAPAGSTSVVSFALPGRSALRARIEAVEAALASPAPWPEDGDVDPHTAAWTALSAAADDLLPPDARALLDDRPLHIRADGVLDGFPFSTLVLAPPARAGLPPTFLATDRPVLNRGTGNPAAAPAAAGAALVRMDIRADDARAIEGILGAAWADLVPKTPADVAAEGRVLHAGGSVPDTAFSGQPLALLIVDGEAPSMPLTRWSGVGEVLAPPTLALTPDPRAAAALWSHLTARPARPALVFTPNEDGRGALMPGTVAQDAPAVDPSVAVRQWRRAAMTRPAVPGVVPTHHPAHWSRWRRIRP